MSMTDTDLHADDSGGRFAWPEFGAAVRLPVAMRRPSAARAAQAEQEVGYAAGHAAGLAAAAEEVRGLKDQLVQSIRGVEQVRVKLDALEQQRLIDLAHAICSKVLDLELSTQLTVFASFVHAGIAHLEASAATVRVHVNPADVAWLDAQLDGGVLIEADAGVPEGGCSVRTDQRSVDYDPYGLLEETFAELRRV